jgi:hypothetical protein
MQNASIGMFAGVTLSACSGLNIIHGEGR